MNDEKFYKNVEDIEFKCNELISEINDHLILYSEPQPQIVAFNNQQKIDNDEERIIPDVMITTCHKKLINFGLNHCEKNKIHKSKNTDAVRIHVPKNMCVSLTKINQILIPCNIHSNNQADLLDSNLELHQLKHMNIDPRLTKQVAFEMCQDKRKLTYRDLDNIIHDDIPVENEVDLKKLTNSDLKDKQFCNENGFHVVPVTCEQNIDTEIEISLKPPTNNELRNFLYGKMCTKMSSNSPMHKKNVSTNRKTKLNKLNYKK